MDNFVYEYQVRPFAQVMSGAFDTLADSCNLIQTGQALVSREEILDVLRGIL